MQSTQTGTRGAAQKLSSHVVPDSCEDLARRVAALENNPILEDRIKSLEDHVDDVDEASVRLDADVKNLTQRMNRSEELHNDHKHVLTEIHGVLTEMKELLKTWNSVKSTVSVGKTVGDAMMWLSKAGAAIAVIWAALKYSITH